MRKIILLLSAALLLLSSAPALAADASNFAIIDVQRIVTDSKRGQKVIEEVKAFTDKKRAEAEVKLAEREKKAMDLEKKIQSGIMSEDAAKKEIAKFQTYAGEVEEYARNAEKEARDFAEKKENSVKEDLEAIVDRIGKDKGYLLIFRYENVVYNDESVVEITDDIIAAYDSAKEAKGKKKK